MKSTDLRAKARAIFGPANPEPMPNQPNGAKALQQRANARPIPTYKVGGVVKKADGGSMPKLSTREKKMGDALMMTRKGKEIMAAQAKRDAEKERMGMAKRELADKLLGIPKKKDGGKLSEFEKAFAGARKEGKKTFDYSGKSYTTEMRGEKKKDCGDAFAAARKAGKATFDFGGKSYTTKTREEDKAAAPKPAASAAPKAASPKPAAPAAAPKMTERQQKLERLRRDAEAPGASGFAKDRYKMAQKSGMYKEGGKACGGAYRKGGKVQTSADTAKKLATEMGGMKKGGKAKDGLAVMIAIGKPMKKPVKKAVGGVGKTRKGMAPIKKAQGGAAKVRKGMMSETGDIKQVVKPKKGLGGM